MRIELPNPGGEPIWLEDGVLEMEPEPETAAPVRIAYAAAHIILEESYRECSTSSDASEHVDWKQTMAFRQHLASHGFGIAEAMDTAQRFELGWPAARRLIEECGSLQLETGFIAGAGADQCDEVSDMTTLIDAVVEQVGIIQQAGGIAIILPMPWLCSVSPPSWSRRGSVIPAPSCPVSFPVASAKSIRLEGMSRSRSVLSASLWRDWLRPSVPTWFFSIRTRCWREAGARSTDHWRGSICSRACSFLIC